MRRLWIISVLAGNAIFGAPLAQSAECAQNIEPKLVQQFQAALAAEEKVSGGADSKARTSEAEIRAIYGCDDRRNYYDTVVTDSQRKAAQATAIVVRNNQLGSGDGGAHFDLPSATANFCSPQQVLDANRRDASIPKIPERFWEEPAPGFCSSFKVGPRTMASAGHCIKSDSDCRGSANMPGISFVFGFWMASADARPEKGIPKANIYKCVRIIGRVFTEDDDYSIVEVDRDIDAPQVMLRNAQTDPALKEDSKLTVVGYPMGLPVKIADGAAVRRIKKKYLVANLDTYEGNSGSAVFNSDKLAQGQLLVEGILVRGENDFLQEMPCNVSRRCPNTGCRGEDVTLPSTFSALLRR
jgi:V8-like Glu-specific endopeptidase